VDIARERSERGKDEKVVEGWWRGTLADENSGLVVRIFRDWMMEMRVVMDREVLDLLLVWGRNLREGWDRWIGISTV
jgi:hypothetical protein